jgi:hypothetical protein
MSDAARDTERLNRAIERLTSHQPVLMFEDAELDELLDLARQLNEELPDDLPDPVYREALREQLLDPRPRLVAPTAESATRRRRSLSVVGGTIAAVFVVAVAVGLVASGQFGGDAELDTDQGNAEFFGSHNTVSTVATVTATVGGIAVAAIRETQLPAPSPTLAQAAIPPLDAAHIEYGAMGSDDARSLSGVGEITYELASAMPENQVSGAVYRFKVPDVDAMSLLNRVTDALELDGEMVTRSVRGKTVITFNSTNGTTFTWMPASGAFACNLSGEARMQGNPEEMIDEAYAWLRSSGFPLGDPLPEPVVKQMADGMIKVDFPVEPVTDVAVGHPLSVSVMIAPDGVIQSVSGYWLQLIETSQVGMLSPEDAWQELADGKGYWSSVTPIDDSGHFQVESFAVAYVLTVDAGNQLVLQPVYRASGQFVDYRGNVVDGVSVMIQAFSPDIP